MNSADVISDLLKQLRKERELTQEELSQLAHIDTRHYQRLESGEKLATLPTLFNLAIALSIDPDVLMRPAWEAHKKDRAKTPSY